jgi:uncharacterized membrane protein (UPF0182 family)
MIPIDDSFLFVEPIYLQAENSPLPELKRVIVANGNAISMEASFEESLDVVLGRRASSLPGGPVGGGQGAPPPAATATPAATGTPRPSGTPLPQDLRALIEAARQASNNAQQELDRLRAVLDQIESGAPQ